MPSRTETDRRPAWRVLPRISWLTAVCAPIQVIVVAMPQAICRTIIAPTQGIRGNSSGTSTARTAKNTISGRAPSRSISTPPWIANSRPGTWRALSRMPIMVGDRPRCSAHSGTISDAMVTLLLENRPAP